MLMLLRMIDKISVWKNLHLNSDSMQIDTPLCTTFIIIIIMNYIYLQAATDLLVRQKQLSVGLPPDREHVITR